MFKRGLFFPSISYFVCSETLVIFVQGLLCIFKSVKHQLLLPSGLHVGLDGQVARRPSQPPQKLCIVTGGGGERLSGQEYTKRHKAGRENVRDGAFSSPVLVLQQQLVQLLRLCTAVQVVSLLQNLLCTDTKRNTKFTQLPLRRLYQKS